MVRARPCPARLCAALAAAALQNMSRAGGEEAHFPGVPSDLFHRKPAFDALHNGSPNLTHVSVCHCAWCALPCAVSAGEPAAAAAAPAAARGDVETARAALEPVSGSPANARHGRQGKRPAEETGPSTSAAAAHASKIPKGEGNEHVPARRGLPAHALVRAES